MMEHTKSIDLTRPIQFTPPAGFPPASSWYKHRPLEAATGPTLEQPALGVADCLVKILLHDIHPKNKTHYGTVHFSFLQCPV